MASQRDVLADADGQGVLGFDPHSRSWVVETHRSPGVDPLPRLDGQLSVDQLSLAAAGRDLGNSVHNIPSLVLRPGSAGDVQKMVRFCARHGIKVAARGQGHMTFGQAQVSGGVVIDMKTLNRIHSIGPTTADVDGGVTWKSLVTASVPLGLTPPALTGYTNLSVAGTLSVGGVSPTNAQGAQVDRVRELDVVTGGGDLIRCSEEHERDLFEAALAGLGQCGIITRAIVDLVSAPSMARVYLLEYTDNAVFFRDFQTLLQRGELEGLYNLWIRDEAGRLVYQVNAIKHFAPDQPPDDAHLLRGLGLSAGDAQVSDMSYLDQVLSVDAIIEGLRSHGLFDDMLHPWFDVFLPESRVEAYVEDVISGLQEDDVGPFGFMLLLALKRSNLKRPLLRVPDGTDWVYLFDLLTSSAVPGPNPEFEARMRARNRALFEKARLMGGVRYPIGTLPFDHEDWKHHYGNAAAKFADLKHRFDPSGVLTPGPGIF